MALYMGNGGYLPNDDLVVMNDEYHPWSFQFGFNGASDGSPLEDIPGFLGLIKWSCKTVWRKGIGGFNFKTLPHDGCMFVNIYLP